MSQEDVPEYLNLHTVVREAAEGSSAQVTRVCIACEKVQTKKDADVGDPLRALFESFLPKIDQSNSEDPNNITGIIFESPTNLYWVLEGQLPSIIAILRRLLLPDITRRATNLVVAAVTDCTERQFMRTYSVEHTTGGPAVSATERVALALAIANTNTFIRSVAHALFRRDPIQAGTYLSQRRAAAPDGWPTVNFVAAICASAQHGMAFHLQTFIDVRPVPWVNRLSHFVWYTVSATYLRCIAFASKQSPPRPSFLPL